MGNARYSKEIEDIIDKAIQDEKVLERIDKLTKGTKLVCIKRHSLIPPKTYNNFREFLENRKKEKYFFEEGKVYEVDIIQNDYIYITSDTGARLSFELLDIRRERERYPYIFDHFMLESEWLGLQRDENINSILNDV
jgi:hypothetical protein